MIDDELIPMLEAAYQEALNDPQADDDIRYDLDRPAGARRSL